MTRPETTNAARASEAIEPRASGELRFFAGMDRVNLAMQRATDLDAMMRDVLDVVLEVLACDRASLLYPNDPDSPSWRIPMERTRPEHPGLFAKGSEIPTSPEVRHLFAAALGSDEPIHFHSGSTSHPTDPAIEAEYGKLSALYMAVFPKLGKPWGFIIHDCSGERDWTGEERRLTREIAHRLADSLTGLLAHRELQARETTLRTVIQAMPDLVWLKDQEGRYRFCNRQFELFAQASESELIGKTNYDLMPAERADRFAAMDAQVLASVETRRFDHWASYANSEHLLEVIKTPMCDAQGQLVGVLSIGRDITERRRADEQLRIAATAFETQEAIFITDAARKILRVNQAFCAMTGYLTDEALGRQPTFLRSGHHDDAFYQTLWNQAEREGHWQGEVWNRRKNGEVYPEWLRVTAVRDQNGTTTHFVGASLDISQRKADESEIERLAYYDVLTQLPNRRLLLGRLPGALARCASAGQHGALMFIDLDDFKVLNDTAGHDVGDQLLVEAAQRLRASMHDRDMVARIGGDEFVVVLETLGANHAEAALQARLAGEKILAVLGHPYAIAGRAHFSTPSIGITLFSGLKQKPDDLLKQADIAMYQAKSAGRNTLRFFAPDMQAELSERAALEADLRAALDAGQFELHYQPQVDAMRGLIGAEALLRWRHPARGLVAPGQFIPMAEETGLILPIGLWVLETACRMLATWSQAAHTRELSLAVNVSARQFRQPDFVAQVLYALQTTGAPSTRLKLELTESLVLDDVDDTIAKMERLKQAGVGFSMDDFGTGYSSLAYLTRLPLDQLKIDQSFVRKLPDNSNDAAVVRAIITLAKSLGLAVIAEGVETEAQREFLARHHCPTCQGYLFSKPLPRQDLEHMLQRLTQA